MPTHNLPESERSSPLRRPAPAAEPTADGGVEAHPLLTLQRQLGNRQIARLLAQREEAPAPDEDEEQKIQAKHVQREEAPAPEEDEEQKIQAKHLQREEAPAPEEDEDPQKLMQASPEVGLEGGPVSADLAGRIDAQRGGGAALDDGVRGEMEGALGASFEGVRVHSDTESAQLNQSISAKAFTTGSDIFLGQGASAGDRSLMAHELTHVVQQREMSASGPLSVGPAGDSYEQQADATAAAVTSGALAPAAQRKNDE
jgi:hypothetical protein